MIDRYRCANCGRRWPEEETARIQGHAQGNYRRAGRRIWRRVCRLCTIDRIDFARDQQAKQLVSPLNEHAFSWDQAARHFGFDISGLLIDRMTGRHA